MPSDALVSLYVISALFGLFQGGIVPSYAIIIREYFPAREAGGRIGMAVFASVFGMALGGWLTGVHLRPDRLVPRGVRARHRVERRQHRNRGVAPDAHARAAGARLARSFRYATQARNPATAAFRSGAPGFDDLIDSDQSDESGQPDRWSERLSRLLRLYRTQRRHGLGLLLVRRRCNLGERPAAWPDGRDRRHWADEEA